jgi:RNA polymerase sigma-70 factor (ECF subfamily)
MARQPPSVLTRDLALARRAAKGDRAAAGALLSAASGPVAGLMRRMGAQPATADELTQEALLTALNAVGAYRGEAPFTALTLRIAARLYLRRFRREARIDLMADPVDPSTPGDEGAGGAALRLDLDRALAELSSSERQCVSLCHGAGLTHAEIAQALRVPLGTVKSHVTRGLAKLRRLMTDPGDSHA